MRLASIGLMAGGLLVFLGAACASRSSAAPAVERQPSQTASPIDAQSVSGGGTSALLDQLPLPAGATLVREYRNADGSSGRVYATAEPLEQAVSDVTDFFAAQLSESGWAAENRHAAVTSYSRGDAKLWLLRFGCDLPGNDGEHVLREIPPPADSRFFFAIEVTEMN